MEIYILLYGHKFMKHIHNDGFVPSNLTLVLPTSLLAFLCGLGLGYGEHK